MRLLARCAAALAGALVLAGCGSAAAGKPASPAAATAPALPLSTSLVTAQDAWAIVPMASNPVFWQVFARPTKSADWKLVTPPSVAANGGLVAAGTGGSLTVAFRPSQGLTFSPLAVSTDGGGHWAPGLIDADLASSPDALAVAGSQSLALLHDGAIMASSDGGASWHTLAAPGAIAASPAGKKCGISGVSAVSFGNNGTALAAGTCGAAGSGVFAYSGGRWQAVTVPVSGQVLRLTGNLLLTRQGTRLRAAWRAGSTWSASAPLAATGVVASGTLTGGAAWVLLAGGRAATIAGAGAPWHMLPRVPAGTVVLAAGPGGAVDALATHGSTLVTWQVAASGTAWHQVQSIDVPIQYGSSS